MGLLTPAYLLPPLLPTSIRFCCVDFIIATDSDAVLALASLARRFSREACMLLLHLTFADCRTFPFYSAGISWGSPAWSQLTASCTGAGTAWGLQWRLGS